MKHLAKQIEAMQFTYGAGPLWTITQAGGEWELTNASANSPRAFALNQYIDMAGLSQREKTMFIESLAVEFQVPPSATDAIAGDSIAIQVLISDIPADQLDFIGPGFAASTMNAENCALFMTQVYMFTQDTASWSTYPTLWNQTQNGMMRATASDRLYISMLAVPGTNKIGGTTSTIDNLFIPGMRVVVNVDAKEEAEYRYLMRLRRSYELQQTSDRD